MRETRPTPKPQRPLNRQGQGVLAAAYKKLGVNGPHMVRWRLSDYARQTDTGTLSDNDFVVFVRNS